MASIIIDELARDQPEPTVVLTTIGEAEVVWEFDDYLDEYGALRFGAGLIDVSAGGPIRVSGGEALAMLQMALARDVEFLIPDRAETSLLLDDDGGPVDVVTIVAGEEDYLVLSSPGRAGLVESALRSAAQLGAPDTLVENLEASHAIFAIEGPLSWRVVADVLGAGYVSLAYESALPVEIEGADALIVRIGVTGEYGYTFIAPNAIAPLVWTQLASHGAARAGHRARELTMFEVRQPLMHRELAPDDTVVTAGLNWLVDLSKEEFVGREAVLAAGPSSTRIRPIGFTVVHGVPQVGDELFVGTERVGRITYLPGSPGLRSELGLAKVDQDWQASRLEFRTEAGARVQTLAPPYVVPVSWTSAIEA